jgi:hypothetical protein
MALVDIRKAMTLWGSVLQAASAIVFTVAPTPMLACAANCGLHVGMCFHGSGWGANCATSPSHY